jgi:hypothetical protein
MEEKENVFVTVNSSEINNNNSTTKKPYFLSEIGGELYELPVADKTKKQCDLCLRFFKDWSSLYSHKGKLCFEYEITNSHIIQVHFTTDQLYYIEDALKGII